MNCSFVDRQFWTEFIELYRINDCLWRVKSKEYMDRNKRNASYEVLVEKLKERDPDATVDTVKKRINNMRSVFRKEEKKIINSMKSGDDNDVYVPQLWYYNLLLFLRDQDVTEVLPRSSVSGLDEEQYENFEYEMQLPNVEDMSENEGDSNDISRPSSPTLKRTILANSPGPGPVPGPVLCPSSPKRSKKSASASPIEDLLSLIGERLKASHQEDEFDIIGKNVASKLREMTPDMRMLAEKLIQDVLYKGLSGILKPKADLILPNSEESESSVPKYKYKYKYKNKF